MGLEVRHQGGHFFSQQAFLFQAGQCRFQYLGRRRFVAAFALAIKVNRGAVQLKRHGSRFYRGGRAAVLLVGKFSKTKLATGLAAKTEFAAAFP